MKDYGVETADSHDVMVFLGFSSSAVALQQISVPDDQGVAHLGTQVSVGGGAVAFLEGTPAGTLTADDFLFVA